MHIYVCATEYAQAEANIFWGRSALLNKNRELTYLLEKESYRNRDER